MAQGTKPRVAVIGCGAIAEIEHLPALRARGARIEALVDRDQKRAQSLAQRFKARAFRDVQDIAGLVDAAIIAVPQRFHSAIAIELLKAGIDLLVEKPMAPTSAECRSMIAAAGPERILAVGHMRRFFKAHRWLKAFLQAGGLGEIRSFEFLEGGPFGWPVQSLDIWSREKSGGGVLLDTGAHTLDQLIWWLGKPKLEAYRDDSLGGVEADCEIELSLPNGARGKVCLSRTRPLPGIAEICGSRGRVVVELMSNSLRLEPADLAGGSPPPRVRQSFHGVHMAQMKDWLEAITLRRPPAVGGEDALPVIELIEQCYAQRERLIYPWTEHVSDDTCQTDPVSSEFTSS